VIDSSLLKSELDSKFCFCSNGVLRYLFVAWSGGQGIIILINHWARWTLPLCKYSFPLFLFSFFLSFFFNFCLFSYFLSPFLFFFSPSFKLKHARTRPGAGTSIVLTPLRSRYTQCYHFPRSILWWSCCRLNDAGYESRWDRLKGKKCSGNELEFKLFYLLWLCHEVTTHIILYQHSEIKKMWCWSFDTLAECGLCYTNFHTSNLTKI